MLRSTHKAPQQVQQQPLPAPWTEHRAPTGHVYYYNAETKQSTYTRPIEQPVLYPQAAPYIAPNFTAPFDSLTAFGRPVTIGSHLSGPDYHRRGNDYRQRRPEDRPKSKHQIPGCAPWLLVKTRLGRRFVYNPETKESYWKIPEDLVGGVVDYDDQERQENEQKMTAHSAMADEHETEAQKPTDPITQDSLPRSAPQIDEHNAEPLPGKSTDLHDDGSDDYEEVEVTESESGENENDVEREMAETETDGPTQDMAFDEEDMMRQLAEMGEDYDLDPTEYAEAEDAELQTSEAQDTVMTDDEAIASFRDLLDDFRINPYTTWDNVISEGLIFDDSRYTLLTNMKSRKEVFTAWSSDKIRELKQQKEQAIQRNSRIPFLEFLQSHASPKLFWPEFRRKFKRESEMKDPKLSDKEREKLYRDHIHQITKLTENERKRDLQLLLTSLPPSVSWNRSTTSERGLPTQLLTDIRYISLQSSVRDQLIDAHINTLPPLSEVEDLSNGSMTHKKLTQQASALERRDKQVEMDRRRQHKALVQGRGMLRAEEEEIQRALQVGKGGLREQMQD